MSMIFWIFAKFFRTRKLFWIVRRHSFSETAARTGKLRNAASGKLDFKTGKAGAPLQGAPACSSAQEAPRASDTGRVDYLISTVAPAAMSWSLIFVGVVLVDAFLDGLGSALDQVLGLLQAQAGDRADFLDDVDLLVAGVGEDDGELRLLLGRQRRRRHRRGRRPRRRPRRRRPTSLRASSPAPPPP